MDEANNIVDSVLDGILSRMSSSTEVASMKRILPNGTDGSPDVELMTTTPVACELSVARELLWNWITSDHIRVPGVSFSLEVRCQYAALHTVPG